MSLDQFHVRKATIKDSGEIFKLYKSASRVKGNLVREEEEISKSYVESFTLRALKTSTQFVVTEPRGEKKIAGELHCYKTEPKLYNHILTDLTITISPEYFGLGLEKRLLEAFLNHLISGRRDILRVELVVRKSDTNALDLFEQLGFLKEGQFERRIRTQGDHLEPEIPMAWFNPKFARG